jgi:hypothetical protein
MYRICHRCHRDLPGAPASHANGFGGSAASDEEHALFCPWCGAPQLVLQEHMRAEVAVSAASSTTGAIPPPRPRMVEWPVVVSCAMPVAIATGVFAIGGLVAGFAYFLSLLCILGGSGMVLALYRARRPLARIDGRVGLRVGLLTGLMMVTTMGIGLSATGVLERFALHNMAGFDEDLTKQQQLGMQMAEQMLASDKDPQLKQMELEFAASPEIRAGTVLFGALFRTGILLAFTTGLGGFAGLLQTRRRALRSGD